MNKTKKKLIKAIAELRIEHGINGFNQKDVLDAVGLSRASFNRNYAELQDYITGKFNIFLLLNQIESDKESLFDDLLRKYESVLSELEKVKSSQESILETHRKRLITSLMKNDLMIHDSSGLRQNMEKILDHNNDLINKITGLELKLAEVISERNINTDSMAKATNYHLIKVNLEPVFTNYKQSQDIDAFEDEKEIILAKSAKKAARFINDDHIPIVLFIDRYICDFEKFIDKHLGCFNEAVVIQLPIFSRVDMRDYIKQLSCNNPISVYIPHSHSETLTKAQRAFFARDVPQEELSQADNLYIPAADEVYASIVLFKVRQGD
jgi:hypothetical protein